MLSEQQLEVLSLHFQGVQLPQRGLDQIELLLLKKKHSAQTKRRLTVQNVSRNTSAASPTTLPSVLTIPQRITLDQLTWQSAAGEDGDEVSEALGGLKEELFAKWF